MEDLSFTKKEQIDVSIELASNFITKAEASFDNDRKRKFLSVAQKSIDKAMSLLVTE